MIVLFCLFLILFILCPSFRYFMLWMLGLLGIVFICIHYPLAIPFLLGGFAWMFWHIWKKEQQEQQAWNALQKPRCQGYHPNNEWEYLENSDRDR